MVRYFSYLCANKSSVYGRERDLAGFDGTKRGVIEL